MTNSTTDTDAGRIKAARLALCHVAALDARKRTRHWDAQGEAALLEAEATIATTPGRLLLQAIRDMKAGGPSSIDPLGAPTRDTNERSARPQHARDALYETGSMSARRPG